MPFRYRGDAGDLYWPCLNIMTGTAILKRCLQMAGGNPLLAAQYHNAGPSGKTFNGPITSGSSKTSRAPRSKRRLKA